MTEIEKEGGRERDRERASEREREREREREIERETERERGRYLGLAVGPGQHEEQAVLAGQRRVAIALCVVVFRPISRFFIKIINLIYFNLFLFVREHDGAQYGARAGPRSRDGGRRAHAEQFLQSSGKLFWSSSIGHIAPSARRVEADL